MAATPPGPRKQKLDYTVDRDVYDMFMKACSNKGYAPQVVIEKAMRKFAETKQI